MEDLPGYDRWKTSIPEPEEVGNCAECAGEIYLGEDFIRTSDGDMIHEDCWREYSKEKLMVEEDTMEVPICEYCNRTLNDGEDIMRTSDNELVHRDCWDEYSFAELNAERIHGES